MATATNINGFNIGGNNNSFDQRGHFYRGVFSGNVSGMLVKQNSTPNMTVLVEHGSALLNKNTISASIAEVKSDTSVTIDTANTSNPRIDTVVIYEDTSVAIPTVENDYWQDGAGGRFKIVSLPGTAAASPVALSDASVQTAIGAGKPWTRLADITVPANSTTIVNSNIADKRVQMGGTIPNKSVTADKLDFTTLSTSGKLVGLTDDGKNIYERVFNGNMTATADTRLVTTITFAGITRIINASGYITTSSGRIIALGQIWHDTTGAAEISSSAVFYDSGTISIVSRSDMARSDSPYKLILRYTNT